jgi:hypothetical protein
LEYWCVRQIKELPKMTIVMDYKRPRSSSAGGKEKAMGEKFKEFMENKED